jgi:hypothetical protein
VSTGKSTRSPILSSDQRDAIYLARITELEAQVQALTAELATFKALALAGDAGLPNGSRPRNPALAGTPPTHVNADGTQGMRRGVSSRPSPSSRETDRVDD